MPNEFKRKVLILKNNIKLVVILLSAYVIGIVLGIMYFHRDTGNGIFFKHVFNYYEKVFDCYNSPVSLVLIRIFTNLGYFIIVFCLSITVFTYPISVLLIVYRGAIIGCVSGIFISVYSFNGVAVFFGVLLPQNILVTAGIIVSLVLNFNLVNKNCLNKNNKRKELFANCIIGFIIALIGAIYEFLILIILIRPMNFYF